MAKVRSPLHSIDLRGRMADGFVFTVWRGINCLRTFVMPSHPRTQRKEQIWKTTPRVTRAWGAGSRMRNGQAGRRTPGCKSPRTPP
jgi:hypothetical protein